MPGDATRTNDLVAVWTEQRQALGLDTGAGRSVSSDLLLHFVNEARAVHPTVKVSTAAFVAYVAERVPKGADVDATLAVLRGSDLYLACGCSLGDPKALARFDETFLARTRRYVGHIDASSSFVGEVAQRLRVTLLLATSDTPPKIASFLGQGNLDKWVRVSAVRIALRLRRGAGQISNERAVDDSEWVGGDPELEIAKRRYRAEFEEALRASLAALGDEERVLLRFYYLDSLTVEEIGASLGVHFSTVSRRLARARAMLRDATRERLRESLKVTPSELDGLIPLVQSQLHVSLSRILS